MTRAPLILASGIGVLILAACSGGTEAPFDRGVCYAVERGQAGDPPVFNKLADNQPRMEDCAARLEEMRLRFLRQGGSRQAITGSYQGQFIFLDREGVWVGKTLEGSRFIFMARTGDGRLATQGAITRDETGRPIGVAAPPEPPPAPATGQ